MIRFLEMAEHIRTQGVEVPEVMHKNHPPDEVAIFERKIKTAVSKCVPFVFSPGESLPMEYHRKDELKSLSDSPFEVYSLEYAGGAPLTVTPNDEEPTIEFHIFSIMVIELAPTIPVFMWLAKAYPRNTVSYDFTVGLPEYFGQNMVILTPHGLNVVQSLLDRLKREKTGVESTRKTIKLGTGKNKITHRIRQIVHVRPKSKAHNATGEAQIDWSHRFAVRGHWRDIAGIGKDRAGNYCINSKTWVSEHIRGPEHLPFVKKTRLVSEDDNG